MSNKQYRTPAEGAQAPSEARRAEDEALREQAQKISDEYYQILHSTFGTIPLESAASDTAVAHMAAGISTTMWQIVSVTGAVISTVESQQFRNIVGPELRLPERLCHAIEILDADPDDYIDDPDDLEPEVDANSTPPAKRPRGSRHPLLQLVHLAINAARVFEKVTRSTNPKVYNRRTLDEQDSAEMRKVLAGPFA